MELQVLGLGHDPRFCRDTDFLVKRGQESDAALVLTYPKYFPEDLGPLTALIDLLDLLELLQFPRLPKATAT